MSDILTNPKRSLYTRLESLLGAAAGFLLVSGIASNPAKAQTPQSKRFPIVRLIPDGFRLVSQELGGLEGFNGGNEELFLFYASTNSTHPHPTVLHIALTTNPKKDFASTAEHVGEAISVKFTDGQVAEGIYHDGMWAPHPQGEKTDGPVRLRWTKGFLHALVFKRGSHTIGLRASVRAISKEDLVRIAGSTE